ncbi:hypothetical protein FNU76_02530 [Chitinimonas arctica]|uniref:DUF669 domain-containing protein n=1 Tax=Chitinimonas arctica TaxID=2594795 RepID=A0A516SB69_9NEIS|nr:hypothetical protein [Chitinimonas arctica]QDQ25318.1 hypothetical protein FNU76_02530 [Chitinimonas arctica]
MTRSYNLDTKAAEKADAKSSRIQTTGEYIGAFKYAIAVKSSRTGTEGIELHFEDTDKQEARITLWTAKASGEMLTGNNVLHAIMTCLSLRGIQATRQTIELYDHKAGAKMPKDVEAYPELAGKRIGLLLQLAPEEYLDQVQEIKVANRIDLYSVFNPDTRMLASEILRRAPKAEMLDRMKASLKDKALKKLSVGKNNAPQAGPASGGGFDDFEDDIPF